MVYRIKELLYRKKSVERYSIGMYTHFEMLVTTSWIVLNTNPWTRCTERKKEGKPSKCLDPVMDNFAVSWEMPLERSRTTMIFLKLCSRVIFVYLRTHNQRDNVFFMKNWKHKITKFHKWNKILNTENMGSLPIVSYVPTETIILRSNLVYRWVP